MQFATYDDVLDNLSLSVVGYPSRQPEIVKSEAVLHTFHKAACITAPEAGSAFIPASPDFVWSDTFFKPFLEKGDEVFEFRKKSTAYRLLLLSDLSLVLIIKPEEGSLQVVPRSLALVETYHNRGKSVSIGKKYIHAQKKWVTFLTHRQQDKETSVPVFEQAGQADAEMGKVLKAYKSALRRELMAIAEAFHRAPPLAFDLSPDTLLQQTDKVLPHYANLSTMSIDDKARTEQFLMDVTDYVRIRYPEMASFKLDLSCQKVLSSGRVKKISCRLRCANTAPGAFPLPYLPDWIEGILSQENEILPPENQLWQIGVSPGVFMPQVSNPGEHLSAHRKIEVLQRMAELLKKYPMKGSDPVPAGAA